MKLSIKWPQHKTPASAEFRATASFNFIPLPEAILLSTTAEVDAWGHGVYSPDRLHGWIDVEIRTETPLYTRCAYPLAEALKDVRQSVPRQQFYHHGDAEQPVIPGASLRGAIRNLVEILSYSRISRRDRPGEATRLLDEKLVYRAVTDQKTSAGKEYNGQNFLTQRGPKEFDFPSPYVKAGWLEKGTGGGMQIRPAQVYDKTSFVRVPTTLLSKAGYLPQEQSTETIFVRPAPVKKRTRNGRDPLTLWDAITEQCSKTPASDLKQATLIQSGRAPTRHYHTAVYPPDANASVLPIPGAMWEQYVEDRELTRGIATRKLKDGDPCFYLEKEDKLIFLGPTLFFRIPYSRYTADFVPGGLMEGGGLDIAEALFGTVNPGERKAGTDQGAFRGRVRFGDAQFRAMEDGGKPFFQDEQRGRRVPGILSSPKPTSFQHYLVQTGAGSKDDLLSYASSPAQAESKDPAPHTVLRGFKRYWHRGSPGVADLSSDLAKATTGQFASQHTIIRPVRARALFTGRIHFENLQPLELGALLTALELLDDYRHHLGMGKPLGLGTVKLTSSLTLWDPKERYTSLDGQGLLPMAKCEVIRSTAKQAFQDRVIMHHNDSILKPQLPSAANLWQLPRLEALRLMLTWQERPERRDTEYQTLKPNQFKERPTLPTPQAVMRKPDPRVDADVPVERGTAPQLPGPGNNAIAGMPGNAQILTGVMDGPAKAPPPVPAVPTRDVHRGQIVRRSDAEVLLRIEGATATLKVPLSTDTFPMSGAGAWPNLRGGELKPGRRVRIEMIRDRVVKVTPE